MAPFARRRRSERESTDRLTRQHGVLKISARRSALCGGGGAKRSQGQPSARTPAPRRAILAERCAPGPEQQPAAPPASSRQSAHRATKMIGDEDNRVGAEDINSDGSVMKLCLRVGNEAACPELPRLGDECAVLAPRGMFADGSRRRRGCDVDIPWRGEKLRRRRGRDAEIRSRPADASGTLHVPPTKRPRDRHDQRQSPEEDRRGRAGRRLGTDGGSTDDAHRRGLQVFCKKRQGVRSGVEISISARRRTVWAEFTVARLPTRRKRARTRRTTSRRYGEKGAPPDVPPRADLVFEIDLKSICRHADCAGDGSVMKLIDEAVSDVAQPTGNADVSFELRSLRVVQVAKNERTVLPAERRSCPLVLAMTFQEDGTSSPTLQKLAAAVLVRPRSAGVAGTSSARAEAARALARGPRRTGPAARSSNRVGIDAQERSRAPRADPGGNKTSRCLRDVSLCAAWSGCVRFFVRSVERACS